MGNGEPRGKQPAIKLEAKPQTLVKFYFIRQPAIQLGPLLHICVLLVIFSISILLCHFSALDP